MLEHAVERSEQEVAARRQIEQAFTGAMTTLRRVPVVTITVAGMPPVPSWWTDDEDTLVDSTQTLQQMRRG